MDEDKITATDIKNYFFCPRTIYFTSVLGYTQETTEYMIEGREEDQDQQRRARRRRTVAPSHREKAGRRWRRIRVESRRLGLTGVVDEVVETKKGLVVLERKHSAPPRNKPPPHHIYQAVAYAVMTEETLGRPVTEIAITYTGGEKEKTIRLRVTQNMRNQVAKAAKQIREIIRQERLPQYKPRPQCKACTYLPICKKT